MYDNELKLRLLNNNINDYKKLEDWYKNKEVYLNFEQRILTYNEIKNKYYPRTLDSAEVPVYMIEYNNIPIGIIQYKKVDNEDEKLYKLSLDNCFEIDIFIGELNYHNKGLGRKSIELLSDYLFKEKNANLLVMCPLKDNIKAKKCYLKCGFVDKGTFITKDTINNLQEYTLMIKERKI